MLIAQIYGPLLQTVPKFPLTETSFVLRSSADCITVFCWGALNNLCPTLFLVFRTIDYYRQKKNSGQYSKNRPSHFKINYFSLGPRVSCGEKNSPESKVRTLMAFGGRKFGFILFCSFFKFHQFPGLICITTFFYVTPIIGYSNNFNTLNIAFIFLANSRMIRKPQATASMFSALLLKLYYLCFNKCRGL